MYELVLRTFDRHVDACRIIKKAIEEYIKWYNEERINVKRKGLSPLEYRQQSLSQL